MNWEDVRRHILATFVVASDAPERIGLRWTFDGADDVQRQYVAAIVAFGRPHLQIVSNVVLANAMPAHEALSLNARIPIGGLCLDDGHLLLRAVLPLDGIDLAVVDRALNDVAHEAVQLRMQAVRKAAPAPYFE